MAKISVCTPTIRPAGLEIIRTGLLNQTFKDFEWLVEINTTGTHDLNAAYNRMIVRAQGELFVSLQDYILLKPDYLQKWWEAFQKYPKSFMTSPVGKVNKTYSNEPKWDWRKSKLPYEICNWNEWEIDSGATSMNLIRKVGGFDEALDGHWSGDNVNVGCRAQLEGFDFRVVDNSVLVYDHDADISHPFRDQYDNTLNTKRMAMFRGGTRFRRLRKLH